MVIKGNARGGASSLAAHLHRTDTNEIAELRELRGVAAEDLDGALREIEALATGARSARHFYHASINTRADEVMTPEQWTQAVERLEQELGLAGQPRAVVAHVKKDRSHVHIVWSRIDIETLKAIPDSHNYRRHEIVARELEREFGHARVQGAHIERDGDRPARTPSHAEMQQAERTGIDPREAKAQLTEIWNRTDSGKAFSAAAEEQGWALAHGDKRDFVMIDSAGETHSLARRIDGTRAKDIRSRMADIDAASLPSVEEAKEIQRRRQQARADAETDARAGAVPQPEPAPVATQVALFDSDVPAVKPAEQAGQGGMSDNQGNDEAARRALEEVTQRQSEAQRQQQAKEAALRRTEDIAKEYADRQVQQAEEMREQRSRLDHFEADQKRQAEAAQKEAERKRDADARGQQAEGEIRDAGDRYRIAVGQNYDVRDPYGSLAQAAMREYGAFIQDRERLNAQIAKEQDPQGRQALELRRDIEAADYMEITSRRIASQSEVITGRRNSDEAVLFRDRADDYHEQSQELRQQYRELAAERALAKTRDEPEQTTQLLQGAESAVTKEAKEQGQEPKGQEAGQDEITDAKAERIAKIRDRARAFEVGLKTREHEPGGRSR